MNQSQINALASMVASDEESSVRCEDEPVMFCVKARRQGVTAAKYKVARRLIIDKLQSWGEWRVKSNIKTPTRTYNPDDEVMAEGYDHALLSDFDSAMIVIDAAIGKLNKIDRIMLELEYSREYKDPLKQWNNEMNFQRSKSTYDNRLRGLQLDPRIIKACGY